MKKFVIKVLKYLRSKVPDSEVKRLDLHNGACAGRWNCLNAGKRGCKALPQNNNQFIECNQFLGNKGKALNS